MARASKKPELTTTTTVNHTVVVPGHDGAGSIVLAMTDGVVGVSVMPQNAGQVSLDALESAVALLRSALTNAAA